MKSVTEHGGAPSALALCAAIFAAGAVNGLLGTGGGIILTLIFCRFMRDSREAFVTAMAIITPISLISLFTYRDAACLDFSEFLALTLPSAAGGLLGAYLSTRVRPAVLEGLFALLVVYSGGRMLLL